MAKQYKGNIINSVKKRSIGLILRAILFEIILITLGVFLVLKKQYIYAVIPALVATILFFYYKKKYRILKAGFRGEEAAAKILKDLSKKYSVISDVVIEHKDRVAQIDNIILSPSCVFVLEVKNYSGTLNGSINSRELIQVKQTRKGREEKQVYNPFMQAKTHAVVLRGLLKDNGIDVPVDYGVFFVRENFRINFNTGVENVFFYDNCKEKLSEKLNNRNHVKYKQRDVIKLIKNN